MSKRKIIEIFVEEKENDEVAITLNKIEKDDVANEVMAMLVDLLGGNVQWNN